MPFRRYAGKMGVIARILASVYFNAIVSNALSIVKEHLKTFGYLNGGLCPPPNAQAILQKRRHRFLKMVGDAP
jgi:ADP-dependent phosphofructokinase/glucokinase